MDKSWTSMRCDKDFKNLFINPFICRVCGGKKIEMIFHEFVFISFEIQKGELDAMIAYSACI